MTLAVTIKDIAAATGLSIATISKYINGGKVRAENAELLRKTIHELGYHVNGNARRMRTKNTGIVAVMVPTLRMSYCRELASIIQAQLRENGFDPILFDCGDDAALERRTLDEIIERRCDGVVCIPIAPGSEPFRVLHSMGVPTVIVGESSGGIKSYRIKINNSFAFEKMTALLSAAGHTRVGVITVRSHYDTMTKRLSSLREAFEKNGLVPDEKYIYFGDRLDFDNGREGAHALLSLSQPPTAIICLNACLLLGADIALLERGMKVPDDISLCGVASMLEGSRNILSQFTMVVQPVAGIASSTVSLISNAIRSHSPEQRGSITSETEIITKLAENGSISSPSVL